MLRYTQGLDMVQIQGSRTSPLDRYMVASMHDSAYHEAMAWPNTQTDFVVYLELLIASLISACTRPIAGSGQGQASSTLLSRSRMAMSTASIASSVVFQAEQ